jgi:hypothetical protein
MSDGAPDEPPLLGDVAADREGRLSQDCFEVLSLLGAHGALPSVGLAGHRQHCRQEGEKASPDNGDCRAAIPRIGRGFANHRNPVTQR